MRSPSLTRKQCSRNLDPIRKEQCFVVEWDGFLPCAISFSLEVLGQVGSKGENAVIEQCSR